MDNSHGDVSQRNVYDCISASITAFAAHVKETAHTREVLFSARTEIEAEMQRLEQALREVNSRLEMLPNYDRPAPASTSVVEGRINTREFPRN